MTVALVTAAGTVHFLTADGEGGSATAATEAPTQPNPLEVDPSELLWGLGAFLVLFLFIRQWAYPTMRNGMDARAEKIRGDLQAADTARMSIGAEREAYLATIAAARAEASQVMDAARREVEAIRAERFGVLNADLADVRAQAAERLDAQRSAAVGQLDDAIVELASDAAGRVIQRPVGREASTPLVQAFLAESRGAR